MVIREFAYIPYVFWAQPKKQKYSSGNINCAGWEGAGASHSSIQFVEILAVEEKEEIGRFRHLFPK